MWDKGRQRFECINKGCDGIYNPATAKVVYSTNWEREGIEFIICGHHENGNNNYYDEMFPEPKKLVGYTHADAWKVWICPRCDTINDIEWKKCINDTCGTLKIQFENLGMIIEEKIVDKKPENPNMTAIQLAMEENKFANSFDFGSFSNNNNSNNNNNNNNNNANFNSNWLNYGWNKSDDCRNDNKLSLFFCECVSCHVCFVKIEKRCLFCV